MLKTETKETKHETNILHAMYWSITVKAKKIASTSILNNKIFQCIIDSEKGTR